MTQRDKRKPSLGTEVDREGEPPTSAASGQSPGKGSYKPSRFMRAILALAPSLRIGTLTIVLSDGERRTYSGSEPGPSAEWYVTNDRAARRLIIGGILGFCESYLDGDWWTPDMSALYELALLNEEALNDVMMGKPWARWLNRLSHLLRPNTRRGSRRNIAYHYDLGNNFYSQWLDRSMTYSSALFDRSDDLEAAQRRKYEALADMIDLQPGHRLLEIGCGWGGFAEFAAAERGAIVTGITVSAEQHAFARDRMQAKGLGDRVSIELCDYRDVTGQYDRIASIEMFEAVGERYWPVFFSNLRDRLKAGGVAGLQVITIADRYFEDYRRGADYIQRYIFPGGMLPAKTSLDDESQRAGLILTARSEFGRHYARTLRYWDENFQKAWPSIQAMGFDDRFRRMWEQYLHYCAAGFSVGTIDVVQLALKRP